MHLVLNSYGTALYVKDRSFLISASAGQDQLPPEKIKSISISRGTRISSDAILLAIKHEIDLVFVDGVGKPAGRVWSNRYGSVATIRKNQLAFSFSGGAVGWIKELLAHKLNSQSALLLSLAGQDERQERIIRRAINAMADHRAKILLAEGEIVSDIAPSLRGWEGAAGRRYFQAIAEFMPESYAFSKRSQRPATDPFNALLNYGYGMLYGKVEGALIRAGIDPYVGIFHRDDYNRPVLVYDVIERYRVWVDHVVIHLCRQEALPEESFVRKENGGIWLEGIGKRILIQAVNEYLMEVIPLNGLKRSREEHLKQYAHALAKFFLKENP
jgi:CRISPR-associated protein Cas1